MSSSLYLFSLPALSHAVPHHLTPLIILAKQDSVWTFNVFDFQINISDFVVFVLTFQSGQFIESLTEELGILEKHAYFLSPISY